MPERYFQLVGNEWGKEKIAKMPISMRQIPPCPNCANQYLCYCTRDWQNRRHGQDGNAENNQCQERQHDAPWLSLISTIAGQR
jgi:hypothetical protein